MVRKSILKMTAAALLIAVGVVIPMFMPIRFVLEPASFTLASHVAIFIAMMLSPSIALAVAAGTAIGFFAGGFPLVIVLRAASHLVFALLGAFWLGRHPLTLESPLGSRVFSLLIGIVHALCEVGVVSAFYFGGGMGSLYYQQGFLRSVMLLVGVGTVVHSMVDFEIAMAIFRAVNRDDRLSVLQRES